MRTFKITLLLLSILLLCPAISNGQDGSNIQAYLVHEDKVKPSMISEYEQVSRDLVAKCTEHKIQETSWLTVAHNDNSYLYVTPMKKFADIDANPFAALSEKMGAEAMSKLFARFNPCYEAHGDYVIYLNKELSYMPGGITQTPEGKNHRKFYYSYVTPENQKNYTENLKKIKELFTKKNSKMEYRVYKSGFGVMGTYYMVAIASENGEDFERSSAENWENMKDEFGPLLDQMNKYTLKNEEKSGWIRPELAYSPK